MAHLLFTRLSFWLLLSCLVDLTALGLEGRGFCLGNCAACYELLESLPRRPGESSLHHLDIESAGVEKLSAFVSAPEVCRIEDLFPLSLDREFWSLGALPGGASQLNFVGAQASVQASTTVCAELQTAAEDVLAEAFRAAGTCSGSAASKNGHSENCGVQTIRAAADTIITRWRASASGIAQAAGSQSSSGLEDGFVAFPGNETRSILVEYSARAWDLFADAQVSAERTTEAETPTEKHSIELPSSSALIAYRRLAALAVSLSRNARMMMEHLRLSWGINSLVTEISSVYPDIQEKLPPVAFHSRVYGRHFDVLESLLVALQADKSANADSSPLRMAEMGVACGPIGFHLLLRLENLQYVGADPTIRPQVYESYKRFGSRAQLYAMTSEELHKSLGEDDVFDLIFVDGPHTYKNVRNDIDMWLPRVRSGGILAGHDFTCVHPPLLWAVLEARLTRGGGQINVGLDGVWWWRVP